ncbi:MAG: transposase [Planctomycetota bacterium]|nr:transposase [Planctomycetota bacterium]MDA1212037.1 transposase [Planctomycetota bacterium]
MVKGKRYDREFQLNAARLVVEQGYSVAEVSRKLGVANWSISRWIVRFRERGELKVDNQAVAEADELRELRKQNQQLKLEVEILKKAAAYFAKESL